MPTVRRLRSGVMGPLLALVLLIIATVVLTGAIIADKRAPDAVHKKEDRVFPSELDRVRPGMTEQDVRAQLGEPTAVRDDFAGSDRCFIYENLPAAQSAYRLCFDGGRLTIVSPR